MDNNRVNKNYLNGAEALVKMLEEHKVEYIFGLCGDTTLPFYDALYRLDHKIEHILTRDERSAAYMADGYARVTKKVGICEGPSGGGATYILPGLVEANESSIPILAITSDVSVNSRGHYPLTELDQESLMRPVTKWNAVISKSEMIPDMVRTAFRKMTTGRPGSAHLGLPIDVQKGEVNPNQIWADVNHACYPAYPKGPDLNALEDAINSILCSNFPIIICGGGVVLAGATKEFKKFVFVAIALMCCIQFRTNLSAVSIDIDFPSTIKAISPNFTFSPSDKIVSIFKDESTLLKIILASSTPAMIPLSFTSKCALFVASVGMIAREL